MKKLFKVTLFLMVTALLLSGCSKGNSNDSSKESTDGKDSAKTQEVSLMIPEWGAPTKEMLADFEKESGIKVNVMPTNWDDIRNKISTAAAGKNAAADIYEVDWSWVGEFQKAGWLEPIELDQADMDDMKTTSTFMIDNKLYAIPYFNDYRIGFYNKAMYEKAGLTKEPQTWDDVINDAKVLKEKKVVEYPISNPMAADEQTTTTFLWLAYTRNGKVFNDDNTLNEEATLDALTILDKINRPGLSDPANRTASGAFDKLKNGECAFMVGPSTNVMSVNDKEKSKVVDQVMPIILPGKDKKATATVPFAEAIGVSPYSKNKEAAMKFAKWYTSKETQYKLYNELSIFPTRTSVIEQLLNEGKIKNPGAMLELAKVIETPFPNGVPIYYTKMSTEIFNTINQMANEKLTPEQATKQMVTNVNKIVEENK